MSQQPQNMMQMPQGEISPNIPNVGSQSGGSGQLGQNMGGQFSGTQPGQGLSNLQGQQSLSSMQGQQGLSGLQGQQLQSKGITGTQGISMSQGGMNPIQGQIGQTTTQGSNIGNQWSHSGVSSQLGQNMGGQFSGTQLGQDLSSLQGQKNLGGMQGLQNQTHNFTGTHGTSMSHGGMNPIQGHIGQTTFPGSNVSNLGSQSGASSQLGQNFGSQFSVTQPGQDLGSLQGQKNLGGMQGLQSQSQQMPGIHGTQMSQVGMNPLQGQMGQTTTQSSNIGNFGSQPRVSSQLDQNVQNVGGQFSHAGQGLTDLQGQS